MKLRISKYLFLLMMAVFALSSCSEDDNTVDEYANWQERNEKAFADTLAYARQQIANGSDEWKVILNWSLQNQTPNKDANGNTVSLTYKDVDYIVVHVLDKGKGSGCPMYTDSVKVSYRGRMLGKVLAVFNLSLTFPDRYSSPLSHWSVSGFLKITPTSSSVIFSSVFPVSFAI